MGLLDARKIDGFSHYLISPEGEVVSLERKSSHRNKYKVNSKILVKSVSGNGYYTVVLFSEGKGKTYSVHSLVAKAFILNNENKRTVNHKNGITTDNRVENLEWATDSENSKHAFDVLKRIPSMLGKFGKDNHVSKPILQIKDGVIIKKWESIADAARSGFIHSGISKCCRGMRKVHKGFKWEFINKEEL